MKVTINNSRHCINGCLTYIIEDYSFIFNGDFPKGTGGTCWLCYAQIEIAVDIAAKLATGCSGFSNAWKWTQAKICAPRKVMQVGLEIEGNAELLSGAGYEVWPRDSLSEYYDRTSGWYAIGDVQADADCNIEFCTGCIASVINGYVVAIRLHVENWIELNHRIHE